MRFFSWILPALLWCILPYSLAASVGDQTPNAPSGHLEECPEGGPHGCPGLDDPVTSATPELKGIDTCGHLWKHPNAKVLCREYAAVEDACRCVCKFVLCGKEEVDLDMDSLEYFREFIAPGQEADKCFHGKDTVSTPSGVTMIKDLPTDEPTEVQTVQKDGTLGYEPITTWMHRNPTQSAEFVTITTESGHKITMTLSHIIYAVPTCAKGSTTGQNPAPYANRNVVMAGRVAPGNCVFVTGEHTSAVQVSKVVSAEKVQLQGIYAFTTPSGSVVVNGVAASNYAGIEDEKVAAMMVRGLQRVQSLLPLSWAPGIQSGRLFGSTFMEAVSTSLMEFYTSYT